MKSKSLRVCGCGYVFVPTRVTFNGKFKGHQNSKIERTESRERNDDACTRANIVIPQGVGDNVHERQHVSASSERNIEVDGVIDSACGEVNLFEVVTTDQGGVAPLVVDGLLQSVVVIAPFKDWIEEENVFEANLLDNESSLIAIAS